jgi:hypothetical protein
MKNSIIHGIYLLVIAVLSIFFFLKIKSYDKVILKSNEVIEHDFVSFERQSKNMMRELKYTIHDEPKYGQYLRIAEIIVKITAELDSSIQILKMKTTLTNTECNYLRKRIEESRKIFLALIPNGDKEELSNLIPLDTLKNYSFDSKASTIIELNRIKNEISKSKLVIIDYCLDKSSGKMLLNCWPNYRLAIYPKKGILMEGEQMEAEIFISEYSNKYKAFNMEINQRPHVLKEGVALFKDKQRNVGEHKIEATAMIKNASTGDTLTVKGELKYEVLPKCSRDCAKNQ